MRRDFCERVHGVFAGFAPDKKFCQQHGQAHEQGKQQKNQKKHRAAVGACGVGEFPDCA